MIGVSVHPVQADIVREFFELFKTPWEFCRPAQAYDVLLCVGDRGPWPPARLVLLYGSRRLAFDAEHSLPGRLVDSGAGFDYAGRRVPLYGRAVSFQAGSGLGLADPSGGSVMIPLATGAGTVVRIGYDLFEEVRYLLTRGQPPAHAATPALDCHIALLREWITRSGIPMVEIPPVPEGYPAAVCLTHDLDHPVLRNHRLDHTLLGFLGRATAGSLLQVCRGRRTLGELWRNWRAAAGTPLVFLGLARDPWRGFVDYADIEQGLASTYYVIPRKGYAGRSQEPLPPPERALRYDVDDIRPELRQVMTRGHEVGLHGLDAWLDAVSAQAEHEKVAGAVDKTDGGVRMHWLCFNERSPAQLEQAGFSYDASVGYNETVGYRAGTAQVYRHPGTFRLLELPLHVMDTALFFPQFLNQTRPEAEATVERLVQDVIRWGGVLTVNWHDRSILPERLWDGFYRALLDEFKRQGVWFATARRAVAWFRKRRSAAFESVTWEGGRLRVEAAAVPDEETPGLRVRVYRPVAESLFSKTALDSTASFIDFSLQQRLHLSVAVAECGSGAPAVAATSKRAAALAEAAPVLTA